MSRCSGACLRCGPKCCDGRMISSCVKLLGSLAKHGIEQIKGTRVGVEEFEKKSKIKVDLRVYDDESDAQKAVAAVEKLVIRYSIIINDILKTFRK